MTASTIDSMGDFVESVQYKNTLELSDSGNADKTGLFSCDVYSDWVTADQSNSGRKGRVIIIASLVMKCRDSQHSSHL